MQCCQCISFCCASAINRLCDGRKSLFNADLWFHDHDDEDYELVLFMSYYGRQTDRQTDRHRVVTSERERVQCGLLL